MPFADLQRTVPGLPTDTPTGLSVTPGALGAPEDEVVRPGLGEAVVAHFQQDNLLASLGASEAFGMSDEPEEGFSAWKQIEGTDREQFWEQFIDVNNRAQFDAVNRDIDREIEMRQTIEATPWYASVPLTLAATLLDPTILIPGGAFVKGAKGGFSVGRSALNVGIAAGAAATLQEAGLQATQQLRTGTESATAIGASVLLGGLLGAGGAKLLSRSEFRAHVAALDREAVEATADNTPFPMPVGAAAGAQRTPGPDLDALTIAGRAAGKTADITAFLNPGLRLANSPSGVTRERSYRLFEMTQYLKGADEGTASPISVETARKQWNAGLMRASDTNREAFSTYRKRTVGNLSARAGEGIRSVLGGGSGALDRRAFAEEVGKALRRGDVHEIPEVEAAAKGWRENVFEPLKEAAIEAKLLPEDVSTETAVSYFSRMYNRQRLVAEEHLFKNTVAEWLHTEAPRWQAEFEADATAKTAAVREQIDAFNRQAEIEAEIARQNEEIRNAAKPDAPAQPKGERERKPVSLFRFLAANGGLQRDNGEGLWRGELKAMDLDKVFVPGGGRLVRNQGLDLDRARELAAEAGYLPGYGSREEAVAQSSVDDLLVALREEAGGNRVFADDESLRAADVAAAERADDERTIAFDRWKEEFDEITAESGDALPPEIRARAEELFDDGLEPFDALEKAIMEDYYANGSPEPIIRGTDANPEAGRLSDEFEEIPFFGENLAARGREPADIGTDGGPSGRTRTNFRAKNLAEAERELQRLEAEIEADRAARFEDIPGRVREITNEVYDKLTGRAGDSVRPYAVEIEARGPLRKRTFQIPDEMIERWLESDVDMVGRRYHRIMSADVELAREFGSVKMVDQIAEIRADYARLRAQTTDEKVLKQLTDAERNDVRDIEGVRDLLRGTYDIGAWENNYGRVARLSNMFNYVRSMGQVILASLPEAYRTAMVHGMGQTMTTVGKINTKGFKLAVGEAKKGGNIGERAMSNRLATLAEIGDFYTSRGPVEKFMSNMVETASTWNGIRLWTDWMRMVASVATQDQIIGAATSYAKTSQKNRRYLAYLGIDELMAGRIAKEIDSHGEIVDGVRVANTDDWTDSNAVRAYRAAMNKDIDTQVVTRSVADIPLFANTPLGRVLFQFNSFNLASHQRVLLRGLQEGPKRFLSGAVAMTTIGMAVTYLQALAANREVPDFADNPGWWISEGLDKSGLFMVPLQLANSFEKLVGVNPIKAPITAFDEENAGSFRLNNRNISSLLGPTAGLIQDAATVAGIPIQAVRGEDITQGQQNAAERLLPFNSYLGLRQMLRYVVNPPDE